MPNRILSYFLFFIVLSTNVVSASIAIVYGNFLGFWFNDFVIVSLMMLSIVSSTLIFTICKGEFAILSRYGFAALVLSSIASRLYFLFNENPVIPEELTILVKVMPLHPVLRLPWFFQNYHDVLGAMYVHPPISFIFMNIGYLIIPNIVGLRLFSFLFSVLSVGATYFVAKGFSERIAYPTALFYSLNPLTVMFTVVGYTDTCPLTFGLFGLLLFIRALEKGSTSNFLLSGFLVGLSLLSKSTVGYLWVFLIILFAVHRSSKYSSSKSVSLKAVSLSISSAFLTILPWAFLNYESFIAAYVSFPKFLISRFLEFKFVIGVTNPTRETAPSAEGIVQSIVYFLQRLFPMYVRITSPTVSYIEAALKLFIFLTPSVFMIAIAGLIFLLRHKKYGFSCDRASILVIWILVPLVAFLVLLRDVRYFLPAVLPVTMLCAYWVKGIAVGLGRAHGISLIGFVLVFLLISSSVANQSYAGVAMIKKVVDEYDIPHERILTNYGLVADMFPESKVSVICDSEGAQPNSTICKESYDCVIIWYHNRGATCQLSEEAIKNIASNFTSSVVVGSNFSYVGIYFK